MDNIWYPVIRYISLGIAMVGSVIITVGVLSAIVAIISATIAKLRANKKNVSLLSSLEKVRRQLLVPLLIGLDFFIAADIIHTILEHTPIDLALLLGIVAIRIALSYFLMIETKSIDKTQR